MPTLRIVSSFAELPTTLDQLIVVGRQADLAAPWAWAGLDPAVVDLAARLTPDCQPKGAPVASSLLPAGAPVRKLTILALRDSLSRSLSPTQSHEISASLRGALGRGQVGVVFAVPDAAHAVPCARAVARVLPAYDRKSAESPALDVHVLVRSAAGDVVDAAAGRAADVTRLCGRLVDMPPAELDTARFEAEARAAVAGLPHVTVRSIVGDALLAVGLGGLHAVGRTAMEPARLVVLDYQPPAATQTVALIGKGLVYDTGGLSLKIVGDRMLTMKCDMGGAAAVLGAFVELAAAGAPQRIVAALAMAENAIGPNAYRPDDVLTLHSGKTVEINNTDAEGRLVLADAASYVARTVGPAVLIDAATLTGAQLMATGKAHAAIVSNDAPLEAAAVAAGLRSGDHCWPLPFMPELMEREFKSKVADMRNSVADRTNAQTAAAAWFVWTHIEDLPLRWLHIDLAGPAFLDNRGTGYGIGLIVETVKSLA